MPQNKDYYHIGEIAKKLKVSQRTIRYYEEIGLLKEAKRMGSNFRIYDDEDLMRIKFIQKLKLLGLKLSQIQELEKLYRGYNANKKFIPRLIEMFDDKTSEIDEKIGNLQNLREEILSYKKKLLEKLLED